jgi:S-adenosyl methyltransferase
MTSSMVRDDAPGQRAGRGGPAVAPAGPTDPARPVGHSGLIRAAAGSDDGAVPHPTIAPRVAHRARVYDYWLGGRDNFAADREAGDAAAAAFPGLVHSVRATRAFLSRSVRLLAAEAGVTQFLDIGAGLPTAGSTHEVAQAADPDAMVVYLDIDPVVFAHGRALLASGPHGNTSYLRADLRDPATIVTEAARMLDLTQPVAVVAVSVLQFIPDEADPYQQMAAIMDALAPGSYLVIGHPGSELGATAEESLAGGQSPVDAAVTVRSRPEVSQFFAGLRLLRPGLVRLPAWRPDSAAAAAAPCPLWGGVGTK